MAGPVVWETFMVAMESLADDPSLPISSSAKLTQIYTELAEQFELLYFVGLDPITDAEMWTAFEASVKEALPAFFTEFWKLNENQNPDTRPTIPDALECLMKEHLGRHSAWQAAVDAQFAIAAEKLDFTTGRGVGVSSGKRAGSQPHVASRTQGSPSNSATPSTCTLQLPPPQFLGIMRTRKPAGAKKNATRAPAIALPVGRSAGLNSVPQVPSAPRLAPVLPPRAPAWVSLDEMTE